MRLRGLAVCLAAFLAASTHAEVVDSAANGFTLRTTLVIKATPADVYRHLIGIGDWWSPAHTYSGDSHNLTIDARPGGCLCEKLAEGGVHHMDVVTVMPGKRLVMTGGLGPLQAMGVHGSLKIDLSPMEGDTKLEATYAVGGYSAAGLDVLAAPVDGVLSDQFGRLKNLIEHGNPTAKQ